MDTYINVLQNLSAIVIGVINVVAWVIIVYAVAASIVKLVIFAASGGMRDHLSINRIRADLGKFILLGLEFLIAKDVLLTVFERTLDDLINLAFIIVIRVVLSHFLNKEIKEIKKA